MATETEICNLALSHLNYGVEIASLDEDTEEANACRRVYETARDELLRDYEWPFATKFAALAEVEADPTDEWGYSYRYPSDCKFFRRIVSGQRTDTNQTAVPYRIGRDSQGLLIYTDEADAEAEYSYAETDSGRFPPDFVVALSYRIAAYVAPRLAGGDPFKLGPLALQLYQMSLAKAYGTARREEQPDPEPDSEWISGR